MIFGPIEIYEPNVYIYTTKKVELLKVKRFSPVSPLCFNVSEGFTGMKFSFSVFCLVGWLVVVVVFCFCFDRDS